MHTLFDDIDIHLATERRFNTFMADRFLTDYSAPFRNNTDNWSVPPEQLAMYHRLARKEEERKAYRYQWGGTMSSDENGNVTIHYGQSSMVIPATVWGQFLQDCFSQSPTPHPGTAPGQVVAGGALSGTLSAPVASNNIQNDDRPGMREKMERNLHELEKWAVGSSQSYPQHK
jgi:hypothetical protein